MEHAKYIYIGLAVVVMVSVIGLVVMAMQDGDRVYCEQEQREVDMCKTLWDPVCGYTEDGQKETYGNSCEACKDPDVEYWVEGEC